MDHELEPKEEQMEAVKLVEKIKLVCLGQPTAADVEAGARTEARAEEKPEVSLEAGADHSSCQPEAACEQSKASQLKSVAEWETFDWIPDYEVVEKIGSGSLTTVYKVRRRGINEVFAAKVLRPEYAHNAKTSKRFMQEAHKAASLDNAHLVSVYEVGKTSTGEPFLVCDWIECGSLADRLAQTGRLAQVAVLDLFLPVCEGLNEAHKNGVLHRDIKPGNIVFKQGVAAQLVKLADFGIAKVLPSAGRETKYLTPEGEAFGNPTYMSPEQIQGARLDARADIYALGCVMYECLCGEPPFSGPNCIKVALQQIQDEPKPLRWRALGVKLSLGMEVIVMRMIAKDPDDRYQSVEELIADLKLVRSGGTPKPPVPSVVTAEPVDQVEPSSRPAEAKIAEQKIAQALGPDASPRAGLRFDGKLAGNAMQHSEPARPGAVARRQLPASIDRFARGQESSSRLDALSQRSPATADAGSKKSSSSLDALSLKTVIVASSTCGIVFGILAAFITIQTIAAKHAVTGYRWSGNAATGDYLPGHYALPEPQYYSLMPPSPLERFHSSNMQHNQPLEDHNNRVVFYYTKDHLRDALQGAIVNHENLALVNLSAMNLSGLDLTGARMAGADLRGCDLASSNLFGADLRGADLTDAQLTNCDLRKTNLANANLTKAKLYGANLRSCNLKGANLTGTEMSPGMLDGTEPFYKEPDRVPDFGPTE